MVDYNQSLTVPEAIGRVQLLEEEALIWVEEPTRADDFAGHARIAAECRTCVAIFGGTIVPTYSVVMAHVNDAVGEGEFVAASGGLLIMQGAGAVAGPIIAGFSMSALQLGLSQIIIAAPMLLTAFGVSPFRPRAA